ncbi:hypothetical protein Agabi119p4_6834 [Agaricus bisporus var. burnettii]|uniref:Uncharacterized protein n=1 Tax=Agaricus bisporus var. burnettii TaxID=192524 RepID=A0A8H7F094_AGABI|nr:hypothetical protein Agabi119p4_6834 [Agaricus bisporus var. burnettii]
MSPSKILNSWSFVDADAQSFAVVLTKSDYTRMARPSISPSGSYPSRELMIEVSFVGEGPSLSAVHPRVESTMVDSSQDMYVMAIDNEVEKFSAGDQLMYGSTCAQEGPRLDEKRYSRVSNIRLLTEIYAAYKTDTKQKERDG